MAITDSQKVDFIIKKLGYGVSKTDTSIVKSPANENIASPLLIRGENIWVDSGAIPATAPVATTSNVTVYSGPTAIQAVNDATASVNRTWKTNQTNWIGTEFGATYQLRVWAAPSGTANAAATGTRLYPDGNGNSDSWFFDYQSGVLNFADTNVPSAVSGNVIFVEGCRYTGVIGINNATPNAGNITFSNTTISTFVTNGNIKLDPNGTGNVILDAETSINGNVTVGAVYGNSTITGTNLYTQTGSFSVNVVAQQLTTNTTLSAGGSISSAGNISASGNVSGNNATFSGTLTVSGPTIIASNTTISSTQVNVATTTASTSYTSGAVVVAGGVGISGNLNVNGSIATSNLVVTGGDLVNVNIGNITFSNTAVSTRLANGNITLTPTGTGLVYLDTPYAVRLPFGNTAQQPTSPPTGAFRYNTETMSPEFYNGSNWIQTTTTVDSEIITPNGTSNTFILGRVTNTTGVIVSMNGVIQLPGTAYVISGNQITFTEIPVSTDVIDLRYISTGSVVPVHEEQSFFVRTVSFNAVPNTRYAVDTSAGSITVTLPAIPNMGDAVFFADSGGAYSTHSLFVDPNGETIMGLGENLTVSTNNQSFGLFWNGTTWRIY